MNRFGLRVSVSLFVSWRTTVVMSECMCGLSRYDV